MASNSTFKNVGSATKGTITIGGKAIVGTNGPNDANQIFERVIHGKRVEVSKGMIIADVHITLCVGNDELRIKLPITQNTVKDLRNQLREEKLVDNIDNAVFKELDDENKNLVKMSEDLKLSNWSKVYVEFNL